MEEIFTIFGLYFTTRLYELSLFSTSSSKKNSKHQSSDILGIPLSKPAFVSFNHQTDHWLPFPAFCFPRTQDGGQPPRPFRVRTDDHEQHASSNIANRKSHSLGFPQPTTRGRYNPGKSSISEETSSAKSLRRVESKDARAMC